LVTGALGGLGTAIVQRLIAEGVSVIACDRRTEDAAVWLDRFTPDERCNLAVEALDITKQEQVDALREKLDNEGVHVAYLINNAGIAAREPLRTLRPKTFDIVVRVNLYGTFYLTRAFCEPMMEREFGRIVNFASLYAYSPGPGQSPYAAGKGGVIGYTHSTANDLGKYNITVNVIAPGMIFHERIVGILPDAEINAFQERAPLARLGKPEEIAGTVAFLVSDDAAYITGQTIHVNGGAYMTG
jgi:3-oxoacyl-[acyl-carrier protein] reductase